MWDKVLRTIDRFNMIERGDTVAVGLSGGADSVCLLHFLSTIRDGYGIVLKAVHVNHGIRGAEADRDEAFVKSLCEKMDIELFTFYFDVPSLAEEYGMGLEECGRKVRYEAFSSVEADKIAVAHTSSDNFETVLFNLVRGSSLTGICGIQPKRDKIIRPLINITRTEVEEYCAENGLEYITDSTNSSTDYSRNRIRHNVIPALKSINPSAERSVDRFVESVRRDDEYLTSLAEKLLSGCEKDEGYDKETLKQAPASLKYRACALILKRSGIEYGFDTIERCVLAIDQSGKIEVSGDTYFDSRTDLVSVIKKQLPLEPWRIKASLGENCTPYGVFRLKKVNIRDEKSLNIYCTFDFDKVDFDSLSFRSRCEGDVIGDPVRKVSKSLKKLFIEEGIDAAERNRIPVLSDENGVIWVKGFRTDRNRIPSSDTQYAVIIEEIENEQHD